MTWYLHAENWWWGNIKSLYFASLNYDASLRTANLVYTGEAQGLEQTRVRSRAWGVSSRVHWFVWQQAECEGHMYDFGTKAAVRFWDTARASATESTSVSLYVWIEFIYGHRMFRNLWLLPKFSASPLSVVKSHGGFSLQFKRLWVWESIL